MVRPGEGGAAAIEMAMFMVVLLAVILLTAPLASALIEQSRLGSTAGAAVRFASVAPDRKREACTGTRLGHRSPSAAEVEAEARCIHFGGPDEGPAGFVIVSPDPADPGTSPGDSVTVTLRREVDLGPIGAFFDRDTVALESSAVAVKE